VLNLRHSNALETPKTGQNDTILGLLFVQMHKMSVGQDRGAASGWRSRQESNLQTGLILLRY
jgi:hypothetical protein